MKNNYLIHATIYTDGSCHTQHLAGAWVAIVFVGDDKFQMSGIELNTTHHRMELTAVIKAIEYIQDEHLAIKSLVIYTDSQYVVGLQQRRGKITAPGYVSKKGNALQNADLVNRLFTLSNKFTIDLVKVKAHQIENESNTYNIEADMLSRTLVREVVKERFTWPHQS